MNAPSLQRGEAPPEEGVWIADTLGELGLWYRLGRVAFIGRSLIPPGGGQNPLEPARLGCAISTGPYVQNFTDHVALLRGAGALEMTEDVPALTRFVGLDAGRPRSAAADGRAREGGRQSAGEPAARHCPCAAGVDGLWVLSTRSRPDPVMLLNRHDWAAAGLPAG